MSFINAQKCKVKLKSISQSYLGDCKKGKADGQGEAKGVDSYIGSFKNGYPHGEGIYTTQNGAIYKGHFIKGKKHGNGVLTLTDGTEIKGFWEYNEYIGLYENSFKKNNKSTNVSSFSLHKNRKEINKVVRFYVKENQTTVRAPQMNIIVYYGNYQNMVTGGDYVELTNVVFPVKLKASYGQEYIEFEIFNEGFWNVRMEVSIVKGLNTQN
ncbi:hypothetical protein MWU59_08955 [Flavobacteriaceae bacterium F08102]|nr:hypothetical protein [Flavobacteriaceae bacterium F08102]